MGMEPKFGLITQSTREIGKMIRLMVEASFFMLTEMCMTESGKMTRPMERVSTRMQMVLFMTVNGLTTSNTATELSLGLMVPDTKENTSTGKRKAKELFISPTDQFSEETSKETKLMATEFMNGLTVRNTKVHGSTIKCAEEEP